MSGDLGQVPSPHWGSISSHVSARAIVGTLFHPLPRVKCLLSGEEVFPSQESDIIQEAQGPVIIPSHAFSFPLLLSFCLLL